MSLSIETYVLAKNYTDERIANDPAIAVPNITMTAVQLESNQLPTVTKSGTNTDPTFELGIPSGPQGKSGPSGGYYMPSVDNTGELSWQPSIDTMPSIPSSNIMGPEYTLTLQDKQEIVQEVISSLPVYNGEVQDVG